MTYLERILDQVDKLVDDAYSISVHESKKREAAILRAYYIREGSYRVLGAIAYDEQRKQREKT